MPQVQGPEARYIQSVFRSISHKYDHANHVITLGRVQKWRQHLVAWSEAREGQTVLDAATGTGDLAFLFKQQVGPAGSVTGVDFCSEMLDKAREKSKSLNSEVTFKQADIMDLPFPDNTFDITSIGYGIRNVEDPLKGLREMARVTQPNGVLMIMETGESTLAFLKPFQRLYVHYIMPRLGGFVTGVPEAYHYLNESSQSFPSGQDFAGLMASVGVFSKTEFQPLLFGASYIYKGVITGERTPWGR